MRRLVLVVDDDLTESKYISAVMAADGFNVLQTERLIEGMVWVERFEPAVVMVSEDTGGYEPSDVISIMRRMTTSPLIVIGDGDVPDELRSLEGGVDFYLRRPFGAAELLLRVRRLLQAGGNNDDRDGGGQGPKGAEEGVIRVVRDPGRRLEGGGAEGEGTTRDKLAS